MLKYLLIPLSLGVITSQAEANSGLCAAAFSSPSPEMKWRSGFTNPNPNGEFSATNPAREKKLAKLAKEMTRNTIEDGVAAEMAFIEADGVKKKILFESGGYQTGEITKVRFSNLGPTGKLRVSLLLSASGHTEASHWDALKPRHKSLKNDLKAEKKKANPDKNLISRIEDDISKIESDPYWGKLDAEIWAKMDTFTILARAGNSSKAIVKDAQSQDVTTVQEIELELVKDEVTRISYERSGSAGSAGYTEGRTFDFVWDGT